MKTFVTKTLSLTTILATVTLSGCNVWFLGDDCENAERVPAESIGFLDPFTGQCVDFGGGGGGGTCGDFGGNDLAEPAPLPDFAVCFSQCTDLGEADCLAAEGCRAGYASNCLEGLDCTDTSYTFSNCWATAPSGPIRGECAGLDAYSCSQHDDCMAYHYPLRECDGDDCIAGNFEACVREMPEPGGCYDDQDCPSDSHCDAAETCQNPPGCDPNLGCPPVCYGSCQPGPRGPMSCYGEVLCESLPPDCPDGTVPGIELDCWTGECVAYPDCDPPLNPGDPNMPGTCYGEVFCDGLPPLCPPNWMPEVLDGCFSGACMPMSRCEPMP